jgi:hypothetical protein
MGNGDTQQMAGGRHKEKMAHVKVSELPSGSVPTKEKLTYKNELKILSNSVKHDKSSFQFK